MGDPEYRAQQFQAWKRDPIEERVRQRKTGD